MTAPARKEESSAAFPGDGKSRSFLMTHYVSYVGIFAHASFIPLFWLLHVPAMALFNVLSVLTWIGARQANLKGRANLAASLIATEVVVHGALAVWFLGWDSGFHFYLVPLIAFLMFNDKISSRRVVAAAVLVGVTYLGMRVITFSSTPVPLPPIAGEVIQLLNLLVPLGALAIITFYFRSASIDVEARMEALAMTDALTKLPNRRRMRQLLVEHSVRFTRSKNPFGVILADIDGFKTINDTRGHDAGDHVLRTIARVLRESLREQDALARWGGEEFLFVLPDTSASGAGAVAEKLRAVVAGADFTFGGKALPVTMTFGVTAADEKSTVEDCIRRADQALYAGKDQGKNRVILQ